MLIPAACCVTRFKRDIAQPLLPESYVGALDARLSDGDEAVIDRLVSPGHPSTPGYNDPAYKLEGRVARYL